MGIQEAFGEIRGAEAEAIAREAEDLGGEDPAESLIRAVGESDAVAVSKMLAGASVGAAWPEECALLQKEKATRSASKPKPPAGRK